VGIHLAEQGLFIAVARLLWGFNIKPKTGVDGKPLLPDENSFHDGLMSEPNDFELDIKVRSPMHEGVLREEWKRADHSTRLVKTPWSK
jgi:hypothetical protein